MIIARLSKGYFRSIKDKINFILFFIFLIVPFIKIGGHPLFFLDIPNRFFHIGYLIIGSHELYFLHIILLLAGFFLFYLQLCLEESGVPIPVLKLF